MKRIVVPETYQHNGEEKTSWNEVGKIIEGKNGKTYIKLNMFPNQLFHVFDSEPRQQRDRTERQPSRITEEDMPF